jgi:hypothetical protein
MRFAYQNRGGGMVRWDGRTAPAQTRAGDTRSLGDFYPTHRSSSALRRYGGRNWQNWNPRYGGSAIEYEHDRALGAYDVPLPGAPEIVGAYEPPQPGAALVHLGNYVTVGAAEDEPGLLDRLANPSSLTRKVSAALSAYHGIKRNKGSLLWGALWFAGGYAMPLLVPIASLAQGYAKPK